MTIPVFGVDATTMTGSIALLETLFVVTTTKRKYLLANRIFMLFSPIINVLLL